MLPGIALIGVGQQRSLWVPVPVVLLWPLWVSGWLIWAFMRGLHVPGHRQLWLLLSLSGRLSGLRLDIRSKEGPRFQLRLI